MSRAALPLADRFWAKVAQADENGCRLWTGYRNPQTGYGQVSLAKADAARFGGRVATAPVVACTLTHGDRPHGLLVLHSCDVRACCEPSHLSWGSPSQNNREAWERGGQKSGAAHHQAKLTDAQAIDVIRRARNGESPHALAAEVGMEFSTIYAWLRGEGRAARLEVDA